MRTNEEYKKLSISEFNKAASKYETNKAGVYKLCRNDYPKILNEIENVEFDMLLDAGCGTAPMLSLLKEKYPNKKFVGIDLSDKMIEVAKSKNLDNVEFVVGDCENLPFEENTFDIIINSQSFHHYPNPQAFFDSVNKVLKPGGILILRDMYIPIKPARWFANNIELPFLNLLGYGDVKTHSLDEIRQYCKNSNLKIIKLEHQRVMRMHLVASKI
ncbi:MAG: methyltransferase domain-containing protein [Clostridia bacterium]|nr:methyltransferase domain-containing protein [Clostridia bacterium]